MLIPISLNFVPWIPIGNKWALVQEMAWHRTGDQSQSEPMLIQVTGAYSSKASVDRSNMNFKGWKETDRIFYILKPKESSDTQNLDTHFIINKKQSESTNLRRAYFEERETI